uniref:hypothetical protein n=1 Tax=Escherichia coli TaxID=562 RepID=UPI00228209C2
DRRRKSSGSAITKTRPDGIKPPAVSMAVARKPRSAWVYSAFIVIIHRNNQKKRIFILDPMMQCVPPMMKKVLISLH